MKHLGLPALTGLAHGASDAVAGFLVVQVLMLNSQPIVDYVLIYNVLAFGLQPVAGLLLAEPLIVRSEVQPCQTRLFRPTREHRLRGELVHFLRLALPEWLWV